MRIQLKSTIVLLDEQVSAAFTTFINIIIVSNDVVELKGWIMRYEKLHDQLLSRYFAWSFEDYSFVLWQKLEPDSTQFFPVPVLEFHQAELIMQTRNIYQPLKN